MTLCPSADLTPKIIFGNSHRAEVRFSPRGAGLRAAHDQAPRRPTYSSSAGDRVGIEL